MSATALSKISELGEMGRKEWQIATDQVIAKYPDEDDLDKFDPWALSEKQSLRDRYKYDLNQIRARYPKLQFLAAEEGEIDQPLRLPS